MKTLRVLVATKETQGRRKSDFCYANEGELVCFPFECDHEKVDGRCGCRRSMSGLDTRMATTTFKVVESELSRYEFERLFADSERKAGFEVTEGDAGRLSAQLLNLAERFPVGTVLEKRGDKVQKRRVG